jgi:prephenate dehydratase
MATTNQTIAYQGLPGAYSHLACLNAYPDKQPLACPSFLDAMTKVQKNQACLAMIPLENSTAGRVEEIYRQMPEMALHIAGEHFEQIHHCLLGLKQSDLAHIRYVGSHPQALAQCQEHVQQRQLTPVAKFDTAGAAAELAEQQDIQTGVIASGLAAQIYDLKILAKNCQDQPGNTTRFLVLSAEQKIPELDTSRHYLTSLMFCTRNIPAALYKALGGFATNGINLIKLESYTAQDTLKVSQFHVDVAAHVQLKSMQLALKELAFFADNIRIMGCYAAHEFRFRSCIIE